MIKPYDQDLSNVIVCQTFKLKCNTVTQLKHILFNIQMFMICLLIQVFTMLHLKTQLIDVKKDINQSQIDNTAPRQIYINCYLLRDHARLQFQGDSTGN